MILCILSVLALQKLAFRTSKVFLEELMSPTFSIILLIYIDIYIPVLPLWHVFVFCHCCRLYGWEAWHRQKQDWWLVQSSVQKLWNNHGWSKGMIHLFLPCFDFHFLFLKIVSCYYSQNFFFYLPCLFYFVLYTGNWIWLRLWWIPQFCPWQIALWEFETRPSS